MNSLQELTALRVGLVSIKETVDLTNPSGKALAGMLVVFAEFERLGLLTRGHKANPMDDRRVPP